MKDLKIIYKHLKEAGIEKPVFPVLAPHEKDHSKKAAFYRLLNESSEPDRDAIKAELGYPPEKDDAFRAFLKDRRRELMNGLLHINTGKLSPALRKKEKCKKYLDAGELIINKGGGSAGMNFIRESLAISQECDFTIRKIKGLRFLKNYYFKKGQKKQWREIKEKVKDNLTILEKEDQLENIYDELIIELEEQDRDSETFLKKIKSFARKARNIKKGYSSFNLELYWLDIRIITLELNGNFHKSLEYCHQGREYFEQHPQKTHTLPGIFLIRELNCYLHLKNYPKGLKKSRQIRTYLPPNTQNRLVGYQYVMLFYLHRMKAGEALKAYQEIAEELHENAALSRINWEKILLIRGYLSWLIRSRLNRETRVATADEKALIENYKNDKMEYGFPGISQDKKGHNIAIQVLEFLELYEAGKNDLLLNHSGKWNVYAHRYLKDRPVTERSYLFFW